jgi:hypothetical protein
LGRQTRSPCRRGSPLGEQTGATPSTIDGGGAHVRARACARRTGAWLVTGREGGTPRVSPGVYLLTREASPQFRKPILVRVIRHLDRTTYDGWAWIDVYVRHEALFDRVEVKDLHRCSVVVGHRS